MCSIVPLHCHRTCLYDVCTTMPDGARGTGTGKEMPRGEASVEDSSCRRAFLKQAVRSLIGVCVRFASRLERAQGNVKRIVVLDPWK